MIRVAHFFAFTLLIDCEKTEKKIAKISVKPDE